MKKMRMKSKDEIIAKLIELPDDFKGFLLIKRSSGLKPGEFIINGFKAKVPIFYVNELDDVNLKAKRWSLFICRLI